MNKIRRRILTASLTASAAVMLLSQPLLAAWPEQTFHATSMTQAIDGLDQAQARPESIHIKAPELAESGAQVPVTISSDLPEVDSIRILIAGNKNPLASNFELNPQAEAYVGTRVKISQSTDLIVVVRSQGKLYTASKRIKVTKGGCGGGS